MKGYLSWAYTLSILILKVSNPILEIKELSKLCQESKILRRLSGKLSFSLISSCFFFFFLLDLLFVFNCASMMMDISFLIFLSSFLLALAEFLISTIIFFS